MSNEDPVPALLERWQAGDAAALHAALQIAYPDMQRIAEMCLRGKGENVSLEPAGLIHEVFLRLAGEREPPRIGNKAHFLAFAAKVMRRIVVDRARERKTAKRGGGVPDLPLEDEVEGSRFNLEQTLDIDAALARLALVHPNAARVIQLRYFGGYELLEVAEIVGASLTTVIRRLRAGEQWLAREMRPRRKG
ncbi:MAG: sigma-70 family RNA polymerase sigma factor [Acidobacteria bacterium]|nr:sigma-70 family RNA polymerase sigma factor [Acidobacteriota bacterium]